MHGRRFTTIRTQHSVLGTKSPLHCMLVGLLVFRGWASHAFGVVVCNVVLAEFVVVVAVGPNIRTDEQSAQQ